MTNDKIRDRIAALSPGKKALLERRLGERGAAPGSGAPGDGSGDEPMMAAQHSQNDPRPSAPDAGANAGTDPGADLDFSLLFFSGDGATTNSDKYRLLMECAKYADDNGFAAVWTPERHFKPFGGLYPNPSVIAAALAVLTTRVQLRAGSVVLPLHHPLRVAEEWAVVDNLSGGRVAIAFASGWLADDFVLAPERYGARKELMFQEIQTVLKLWRGESLRLSNGKGEETQVRIYPNPVQPEPPVWITATHKDTFVEAGKIGANVLTGLMEQSVEQCGECIRAYRRSLSENGSNPEDGRVAVMLHTFLGEDLDRVKETVRAPFGDYLRSFLRMTKTSLLPGLQGANGGTEMAAQDRETLLDFAFERYFNASALLGTPESCRRMISALKAIDVDEVACLLDFGLEMETILDGLTSLNRLKDFTAGARRMQQL